MPVENPATAAQVAYLRDLAQTRAIWGDDLDRTATIAKVEHLLTLDLPAPTISALISKASSAPRYPADQVPASEWEIRRVRDLAAEYAIYGLAVTVEETIARTEAAITDGFFSSADARALINLGYRAQPHPTAQTPLRLSDIEGIEDLNVSEGHYAVFDDTDTLRFYRIYTPTSGTNRGVGVIRRFAGDNLMGLYPAEAKVVLEAINTDPDAAAYRFSDTFTRCWVCGKNLTDSVSRLLSVGPTCRGFANHSGLRASASEVDHNPERRAVYRVLREWALAKGFTDPRTREDRASNAMTASRVASAWSGIPGLLAVPPSEAIEIVNDALTNGVINDNLRTGLLAAPKDTLLVLLESGVLSGPVVEILIQHPNRLVQAAANDYFLSLLQI